MSTNSDWRLHDQENYLQGVSLAYRAYRRNSQDPTWDHDHCAFCWAKFMVEDYPEVLHEGYVTEDDYYWICPSCFSEFKEQCQWRLMDSQMKESPPDPKSGNP